VSAVEYVHRYDSPLGGVTMASDGEALTGLWFDGQRYFADGLSAELEEKELPVFALADRWLNIYFSGREPDFTPPLRLSGTPFRRAVWEVLLAVPYGQTVTYAQVAEAAAKRLGRPRSSARAAGGAVGRNPVSLIVPCHRVVGCGGALTGYAGGTDRKRRLLALEQAK